MICGHDRRAKSAAPARLKQQRKRAASASACSQLVQTEQISAVNRSASALSWLKSSTLDAFPVRDETLDVRGRARNPALGDPLDRSQDAQADEHLPGGRQRPSLTPPLRRGSGYDQHSALKHRGANLTGA
jgi:hypothetical protein